MKLMVLDGNSLVNRAFFGIKLLTTKDGRYTNAIYGFQNILLNLLAAHKPDAVAIAWASSSRCCTLSFLTSFSGWRIPSRSLTARCRFMSDL